MNTLKKILTTFIISTLCVAFTSNATPIVTDWAFIVDSAFTGFNPDDPDVTASNNNTFWSSPTTLTWGTSTGDGPSSLDVSSGNEGNGSTSGFLVTDGLSELTSTLTHNNNPITGATLTNAVLSSSIFLNPIAPLNPYSVVSGGRPPALSFNINFKETVNSGNCADVTSPADNKCNDIFVINLLEAAQNGIGVSFDPLTNTLTQMFGIAEHTYRAEIAVEGLDTLADPVCAAAGAASGCVGITTIEKQANPFDVRLRISLVPEPSSVLLMSLALFGIFASMRNKHI
jgi:hypothetical protein